MNDIVSWLITALVGLLLITFPWYLAGLAAIPTGRRPRTRTFDRFGKYIATTENPDYHENPGEVEDAEEEGAERGRPNPQPPL